MNSALILLLQTGKWGYTGGRGKRTGLEGNWISVCGGEKGLNVYCWLKEPPLTTLNDRVTLVGNQVEARVYFWTLIFVPLTQTSTLVLVPHCFDFCESFTESFEIGEWASPNFVLLFQHPCSYSESSGFPYEF